MILRVHRLGQVVADAHGSIVGERGFAVFGDYEVCSLLRRTKRPLRPTQISDALRLTRAGTTGRIDRLVRHGFVERRPAVRDARAVLVALTALGRRRVDQAFRNLSRYDQELVGDLSGEDVAVASRALGVILGERDGAPLSPEP